MQCFIDITLRQVTSLGQHVFERNSYITHYDRAIVLQQSRVLQTCFEWSVQQTQVSAQWSTPGVKKVRSWKLDTRWWQLCAQSLVTGPLAFLTASVNNMLMWSQ